MPVRAQRRGFDAVPLLVAAVVAALDQVTKAMAMQAFGDPAEGRAKQIIPNVLEFRHNRNTGMAFSQLQGQNVLLILIVVVVVALLIYYYRSLPQGRLSLRLAIGAVLGGALGNVIDRIRLGSVTDWIHITRYPTFNLADSFITVGMITLAVSIFLMDRGSQGTR